LLLARFYNGAILAPGRRDNAGKPVDKERASRHHRSLQGELLAILEDALKSFRQAAAVAV